MKFDNLYDTSELKADNFLLLHPFNKYIDKSISFIKWQDAIDLYELKITVDNLLPIILEQYYGKSIADCKRIFDAQYYESTIKKGIDIFSQLKAELKPLDELLNKELIGVILKATGYSEFHIESLFPPPELPQVLEVDSVLKIYPTQKCWTIQSLDNKFYLRNIPDHVCTLITCENLPDLTKLLQKDFDSSIDCIKI